MNPLEQLENATLNLKMAMALLEKNNAEEKVMIEEFKNPPLREIFVWFDQRDNPVHAAEKPFDVMFDRGGRWVRVEVGH